MKKIIVSFTALFVLAGLAGFTIPVPTLAVAQGQNNDNLTCVLIAFDKPVGVSEQALVRAYGGKIKYSYSIVNAVAAQVPESALYGLSHNSHVTAVETDDTVYAVDTELTNAWGVERIGAGTVQANGNTGTGVKIGIIDSGINYNHPDLKDNFDPTNRGYDFVQSDNDPMDVYGHGTHVAGTACAKANGFGVVGVAPNCALYSLRVLNDDGVGSWSATIAALDWVVMYHLQVINLSLGSSQDPGSVVKAAFDNAEAAGIVIVAAAGNSGNTAGKGDNIIYPAKYASVIAVGATDLNDKRANFSSTGSTLELMAPGVSVLSTWNDNTSYLDSQPICLDNVCYYKYGSGTSMASPHVAGAAALVIAAGVPDYNGDGVINNRDVRAILDASATDRGATGRDPQFGYGLVNAFSAVQLASSDINQTPVANAGADQTVTDTDGNGFENVTLDGSGSMDSDGSIVSYAWSEGGISLGSSVLLAYSFAVGNHTVVLTVTDNEGAAASDSVSVNVVSESSGRTSCPPGWAKRGICTP